jgi:hypothetical protein
MMMMMMMMMRCLLNVRGFFDHFAWGHAKNKMGSLVRMGRVSDVAPTDQRQHKPQKEDIGKEANALPTGQLRAGSFAVCHLSRVLT